MKRVVFEDQADVVHLGDCDPNKIYTVKFGEKHLKLQSVGEKYMWLAIDNSWGLYEGEWSNIQNALYAVRDAKIYEFSTIFEFGGWLEKEEPI
jgi:hypothetical protein